jgi:hypothetical protein
MFIAGYEGWYRPRVHLNELSGRMPMRPAPSLPEAVGRVIGGLAQWMAPPPLVGGRPKEPKLEFIVEPLAVPSAVRPAHEPNVLYVRLAAPLSGGRIAVLPDAGHAIAAEVALGGTGISRGVLVGADSLVDPRAFGGPGHEAALGQLVAAIGAFTEARVPFVWRTRGGIDGALPSILAQALVDAGSDAVVELGVPTLDPSLTMALEGHEGATPEQRLRLAAALTSRSMTVRGLIDPLAPMLTDQQQGLEALMGAFADAGVRKVGARYIVLTRERARTLASRLAGMHRALLQGVFADEPWHEPDPTAPAASAVHAHKRIPSHLRRAGHHRLLEAGARHGIFVDVLDPVEDGEDLTASSVPSAAIAPRVDVDGDLKPKKVRRRPQLELFRKSSTK